jgi:hypothetical protein
MGDQSEGLINEVEKRYKDKVEGIPDSLHDPMVQFCCCHLIDMLRRIRRNS